MLISYYNFIWEETKLIKVENVTKKYGSFTAVNNISFEIRDGEIVGFLGKNGAGKSTTMNIITGCIEATEGNVEINGYDINRKPRKAKKEIGYMPEGVPLYNDMTVIEFIAYMADLKGVKLKDKKSEIQKVIEETGLTVVQNSLTRNLSRGYKQRVSMAGALVGNPKVLILDEPTVGLDPQQVKQIRDLIKNLGKTHTVLLSSHILSEVSQICEKVIIIDQGKILAVDTPANLENSVTGKNILMLTVEDKDNKIESVLNEIKSVSKIELIKENSDGTKQYNVSVNENEDVRKEIFSNCAKNDITIFELKKTEATLEEAFLQLISKYENEKKGGEE
jgi:ABC-2 type transport system ATP-binding protein